MGTIAEKLQAIVDSKSAIKTAINSKGGSITDSTPLDEYATAIGNIPTPTLQSKTVNPTKSQQTITPSSGYNGLSQVVVNAVTSSIDANIQAGNIKKNVTILGVTGTYENQLDGVVAGTATAITSNATSIRAYAFSHYENLVSASFPNATTIGTYAFDTCQAMTTLSLPELTATAASCFSTCRGLTTLTLPKCTYWAQLSVQYCNHLTTIDLPKVTEIQYNGFRQCSILADVYLRVNQVVTAGTNLFTSVNTTTVRIHVPSSLIASYKTATNWSTWYNNGKVNFVAL